VARVQFPTTAEYFKGFSLADRTLPTRPEPAWQKMAQSPLNNTTQPVHSRRPKSNHCQTMADKK